MSVPSNTGCPLAWRWRRAVVLSLVGVAAMPAGSLQAGEVTFRRHVLDAKSQLGACAALDVNRDGRLDVVTGGFWYEAPSWKRHFIRQVEYVRGRYVDYATLPLDANGDGWTDFVTANYRDRKIHWIEHPGKSLGPWKPHVVAMPGLMETGRLADVDGDGQMDVLPNGTDFAAWWSFTREKDAAGKPVVRWTRHDLPRQLAGHGIGLGDVNGDGRADLVCPRGWCEAPRDRRTERWVFHAQWRLDRDAAVPIFVHDVDRDGDNDLLWSRGHQAGVYWMEQVTGRDKPRRWVRHAIDTSWSQSHSLLMADVDGDGRDDLIAGKRYLGHDGKDPGEWDPPAIYWYKFDPRLRTWRRGVVSEGGRAALGLDPKAVDLDGDGDVDVLAADRTGLYWFENQLVPSKNPVKDPASDTPRPPQPGGNYPDHAKLLVYRDDAGREHAVRNHADWTRRRVHVLENIERVMGPLPDSSRRVPLDVKTVSSEKTPGYERRKITFAAEPGDRVGAWLLVPSNLRGQAPAMLCLHPTSPLGKDQIVGLGGEPSRFYAHELAQRGYICLAPDYPSFGEYRYDFATDGKHYASGTMKAIWNNLRAVDLLESLPQVHPDRIGCIGHSLGGHNAIFTAVFDRRIRAVVSSCGFNAFGHYAGGDLTGWTSARYMPRIRTQFGSDPAKMPFDFHELVAALAPRPFFSNSPLGDTNFPVSGVQPVEAAAAGVYKLLGWPGNLRFVYPDAAHDFPQPIRKQAYEWLDRQLRP